MKKLLVIMLLQTFCLAMFSQTKSEESRVVDAVSGEPLPYAGVYVSPELGTMTNDDGFFHLDAEAGQPIRISYIGYEKLQTTWSGQAQTYRLKPLATDMREVTVLSPDLILWNVALKLHKEYKGKRRKKANYFYRLTNNYSGVTDMTEAFLSARSAVNIRDMEFYNGRSVRQTRYSRISSNVEYSNLQQLVCMGPAIEGNPFWKHAMRPIYLQENMTRPMMDKSFVLYHKKRDHGRNTIKENKKRAQVSPYYEASATQTKTAEGEEIICLNFKLAEELTNPSLEGRMFVRAKDYRMLSFEGKLKNMTMDAGVDFHNKSSQAETDIRVMYTHERGFTEVESAVCEMTAGNLKSRSVLYNMYEQPLPFKETRRLDQNLAKVVDEAGYDSTLWNTDVVRRTVEEQQLAWFANLNDEEQREWLLTHTDTAFIHAGPFRPLVSRLNKFAQTIPQEKVYLHMDNTSYMLGDTLWFKAYTRQTGTDKPSNVSGVLYAELWNHDGYMMERKLIEMKGGSGHGFFVLNKEQLYGGFYELRAYTRWQLNWGQFQHAHSRVSSKWFPNKEFEHNFFRDYDKLYSRTFPVYDAPHTPGDFDHTMTLRTLRRSFRTDPDKDKLVLTLFPEGGMLVKGVPCRVAYEAAWDDGQWVEGCLYVDNDSFPAVNRGRGTFVYTPTDKKPKIFFRTTEGKQVSAKLPDMEEEGVSLQVIRNGNEWCILTNTTGNVNPADLAMTVTLQGHVERVHRQVGSPLVIPVDELRPGVHQVTVFNTEGRVFADRLFFSYRPADCAPTLRLSGLRDNYKPFEPIKLMLEGKAEASDISIAVRDANRLDTSFDNGNILTEMLLASEIKGFVPNPGFYFEAYDDAHLQALDLLMMTQGWRRFEWRHMAVRGTWDLTQPDEKAPILIGKVYPYDTFRYRFASGDIVGSPEYLYNHVTTKLKREVKVHSELLPLVKAGGNDTVYVEDTYVQEKTTKDGKFRLQLPRTYERSFFYLDASDTTKWTKKRKYTWVQEMMTDSQYRELPSIKHRIKFYIEPPEFYVMVDFPYPRFTRPYTFHQVHLMESGGGFDPSTKPLLSDGTTQLREVTVKSRRSMKRAFNDAYPIFMIDAYEAYNRAYDAGIDYVRTLVSDFGLDFPYLSDTSPNSGTQNNPMFPSIGHQPNRGRRDNIQRRVAYAEWRREMVGLSNSPDSVYNRKQLRSHTPGFMGNLSPGVREENDMLERLDKLIFYSDYAPRLEGSRRYWGSNLPESAIVSTKIPNGNYRPYYRNRRYVLPGFAACGEFYNPDYSKRKPKADEADYRRTLYWNPNVKLDKDGRAEVKFYNNTRTTQISVDAAGQSASGVLLWNAAN